MDNQALAAPRGQVDHAFLEAVEIEIGLAMQRAAELDAGLGSFTLETNDSWQAAFTRMSDNLANWQSRLGELSRQTAALESDLNDQENMLRSWFQAVGATSDRLAKVK